MITDEQIEMLKNKGDKCGIILEATPARVAELEANLNLAGDLLAIVHRDGGHHTASVGFAESLRDAAGRWYAIISERDEAVRQAMVLREALKKELFCISTELFFAREHAGPQQIADLEQRSGMLRKALASAETSRQGLLDNSAATEKQAAWPPLDAEIVLPLACSDDVNIALARRLLGRVCLITGVTIDRDKAEIRMAPHTPALAANQKSAMQGQTEAGSIETSVK